jgi:hypothetical protein
MDEQSQNSSSQDFLPPPSNQLQLFNNSDSSLTPALQGTGHPLDALIPPLEPFNVAQNLGAPFQEESERDDAFLRGM